eukprot:7938567-Pyramimonas_sp.AAC.1
MPLMFLTFSRVLRRAWRAGGAEAVLEGAQRRTLSGGVGGVFPHGVAHPNHAKQKGGGVHLGRHSPAGGR